MREQNESDAGDAAAMYAKLYHDTRTQLAAAERERDALSEGWQRTYDHDCGTLRSRAERAEAIIEKVKALRLSPICCDGENNELVEEYTQGYDQALEDVHDIISHIPESYLSEDALRLDWLEQYSNEAIEVESFIGGNPETDAVFLDWAWGEIPPDFVRSVPGRIAQGRTLREALDNAIKLYPLKK